MVGDEADDEEEEDDDEEEEDDDEGGGFIRARKSGWSAGVAKSTFVPRNMHSG